MQKKEKKIDELINGSVNQIKDQLNSGNLSVFDQDLKLKREKYGENELKEKHYNFILGFLKNFFSPFNVILLAINSYNLWNIISNYNDEKLSGNFISDVIEISIVTIMILISTIIGYVQEIKTFFYSKGQKNYNNLKTFVIRNVDVKEINDKNYFSLIEKCEKIERTELVPGDLIYLRSGDVVPADARIIYANNLTVDQSNLTGESYPVDKTVENDRAKVLERKNVCFQNTVISSGFTLALVIKIGKDVVFHKIEDSKKSKSKNAFNKGLWRVSFFLISCILVMCPIIIAIKVFNGNQDWLTNLSFAVAIGVGITPEMLPVIVSINLLNGIKKLPKDKIIVKNLSTIQNFGAMDVLCLDKTGTLTNGMITLDDVITFTKSEELVVKEKLYFATKLQSGFSNAIDKAIKDKFSGIFSNPDYEKINELPFDFKRKRSTLVLEREIEFDAKSRFCFSKGAVDSILPLCTRLNINDEIIDLKEEKLEELYKVAEKLNSKGFRVVALAEKEVADNFDKIEYENECDLTFVGFATFNDKSKPQTAKFLRRLAAQNVESKVLTGDSEIITRSICIQNNYKIQGVVNGVELEKMTDDKFLKAVNENNVFVKLDPLQKQKIIKGLKSTGKIVGFMGDGGNDIPSFKEADVALSFNDCDPNIKSHADAIILNDNLTVMQEAVKQGRLNFANILKYMKITISSNIGNMISVLVATFWLPFLPMLGIQILIQNLVYDISQFSLINDNVDQAFMENPQSMSIKKILTFSVINGPVSSIFDIVTFMILFYIFGYKTNDPTSVSLFNGGWFAEGLLTQTLVMLIYRTSNTGFWKLKIKWPIILSISCVTVIALILPFTVVGSIIQIGVMPLIYMPICILIISCYICLSTLVKWIYIKIFKSWL